MAPIEEKKKSKDVLCHGLNTQEDWKQPLLRLYISDAAPSGVPSHAMCSKFAQ